MARQRNTAGANPLDGEIKDIAIELIDEPVHDVRKWISAEHIDNLARSLDAVGLIHEPIVTASNGRYEVVSGHCRMLAAKNLRWDTLRCKVVERDEVKRDFVKLHENLYRQDLSAVEKAGALARAKDRYNLIDEDLAAQFGMSRPWVTRVLNSLSWPEDLQRANVDGVLGFEVCDILRKITSDMHRTNLIRYAVEDGCTKRLAKTWFDEWLRNERIKEHMRAREEEVHDHPLISSDDELLESALDQQQLSVEQRLAGLRKACGLCGHHFSQDQLITWDLCPECIQYLYDQVNTRTHHVIADS